MHEFQARDDVSRLVSDLHSDELNQRTTVPIENSTANNDLINILESMILDDGFEGNNYTNEEVTQMALVRTTLVQEVNEVPVIVEPDPYDHLDYDLSNHSNVWSFPKEKPDNTKLHGGEVLGILLKAKKPKIFETTIVVDKPKKKKTKPSKFGRKKKGSRKLKMLNDVFKPKYQIYRKVSSISLDF
ncbi:unnamed protein product [Caenorhabditis bovis]|uniref:Uncharacterized protein n=1 Tax=Caenorhabditis bovis TaxID=2654633 RepID=A0A8S1ETF7_9PELO|nr:unnamed protein product [Caenorhabditis bovis]